MQLAAAPTTVTTSDTRICKGEAKLIAHMNDEYPEKNVDS